MQSGRAFLFLVISVVLIVFTTNSRAEEAPQKMAALIELAEAKFGPIAADSPFRMLVESVVAGVLSPHSARAGALLDSSIPTSEWEKNGVLLAEYIAWLCMDPVASSYITPRGIIVLGARIEGPLDLSFATLDFPLTLLSCSVPGGINIYQANLKTLVLSGSHLGNENSLRHSLNGHMATVRGHFLAAKGFTCTGQVNLAGAKIGGDIDLGGAKLRNENPNQTGEHGTVLDAGGAIIGGSLFFYDGFESFGIVRLNTAEFNGQLLVGNSILRQGFKADGAKFRSSVILKEGLASEGEIRFVGATIEGNFECRNVKLSNLNGPAINALGTTVSGSLYFLGGCVVDGEIRVDGATIGGSVEFEKAILNSPNGKSLSLETAHIGGAFFFSGDSYSKGQMSLAGASFGSNVDFSGSRLSGLGKRALFADNVKIGGALLMTNGFTAEGELKLSLADIRGNFECIGAQLSNATKTVLDFHSSNIRGSVFLKSAFKSTGTINLIGTTIGGDFDLTGATLANLGGNTLTADRINVLGSILGTGKFKSTGTIGLFGAEVARNIDFTGALLENTGGPILYAGNCKIGDSVLFKDCELLDGMMDFTGSKVGKFFRLSGRNVHHDDRFRLDIRHATAQALFDDLVSWPTSGLYNIDGFNYYAFADGAPMDSASRIQWVKKSHSIGKGFNSGPYTQLATVFETAGQDDDAREVRIALERERNQYVAAPVLRIWNGMLDLTVAYGYKPWRSLKIAVVVCFISCLLFVWAERNDKMVPRDRSAFESSTARGDYPAFHPVMYTLDTFLPIIDLQQSEYWRPTNVERPPFKVSWLLEWKLPTARRWLCQYVSGGSWLWGLQWTLIFLGWLLSTLLVVSLTGYIKA